jgi:hypothetical protein
MNMKSFLILIIVLNSIVLLGQLWPEGAPPFARMVNIITLFINLLYFITLWRKFKSVKH